MKRQPRRTRREQRAMRLWTIDQAHKAAPYIASIVRSLREHSLTIRALQRRLEVLANKPGLPTRHILIAQDEGRKELALAETQAQECLDELETLDIYPHDTSLGQVLVPFAQDDQLAWYLFDLFGTPHFHSWRYQSDPESTRRKLPAVNRS